MQVKAAPSVAHVKIRMLQSILENHRKPTTAKFVIDDKEDIIVSLGFRKPFSLYIIQCYRIFSQLTMTRKMNFTAANVLGRTFLGNVCDP